MAAKLTALAGRVGPPLGLALAAMLLATVLAAAFGIALHPFGAQPVTNVAASAANGSAAGSAGHVSAAPPAAAVAALTGTTVEHCYAWDVFNGTGLDADGLSVRLTGVQSVSSVYTGDANPLGEPRPVSGFDAPTGSYLLDLGDNAVTVAPGDATRVGLCSPNAVTGATMQWLSGANPLGDPLDPPAVTWRWISLTEVEVSVHNTSATPVTLLDLRLLSPETQPAADDLEGTEVDNLNTGGAALEDPVLLDTNAVVTMRLPLAADGPAPGDPVALAVEWADGDDLAASSTAYVAAGVPDAIRTYLPAISH
ncbi:MAG: hypothetical protein U0X20_30005 [Caldilineaceae bacterium]